MPRFHRAGVPALLVMLAVAACSSPSAATQGPAGTNAAPTPGGEQTSAPVAGEPCSFLTGAALGAIVGTAPVEVAERIGRGDCDYWLTAAKDSKVNIGVTTGPEAQSAFDSVKGIGEPQPVSLGDEAYSIFNQSIGTLVVVRKGASTAIIQVLTSADPAVQLLQATALAQAVIAAQ
jgi:hypothetical protein